MLALVSLAALPGISTAASGADKALVKAARKGDSDAVRALLADGADVNAEVVYFGGFQETPLVNAAFYGHAETVRILLANGSDVDATGDMAAHIVPGTALMAGALSGSTETVRRLISAGAKLDAASGRLIFAPRRGAHSEGATALIGAAGTGHVEIVKILVDAGADVRLSDRAGQTAEDWARKRNHPAVVRFLTQAKEAAQAKEDEAARQKEQDEEAAFAATAQKFQTARIRPKIPEEAHKFEVQAMYAVEKKRFEDAAARYADALKVAPWWPQARYNRAVILAKIACYPEAIQEMKRYLLLAPKAPDARQAQDKIYAWETEVGKPSDALREGRQVPGSGVQGDPTSPRKADEEF